MFPLPGFDNFENCELKNVNTNTNSETQKNVHGAVCNFSDAVCMVSSKIAEPQLYHWKMITFKGYHFLLKLTLPIAPIVYSYESRTGYIKDAQKFNAWIIRPTERLYLDIVLNNPKNKLSFSKVF